MNYFLRSVLFCTFISISRRTRDFDTFCITWRTMRHMKITPCDLKMRKRLLPLQFCNIFLEWIARKKRSHECVKTCLRYIGLFANDMFPSGIFSFAIHSNLCVFSTVMETQLMNTFQRKWAGWLHCLFFAQLTLVWAIILIEDGYHRSMYKLHHDDHLHIRIWADMVLNSSLIDAW